MHMTIDFPNIGLHLEHVGKEFVIFGFSIAYYGILIGLAILIGIFVTVYEAKRTRQNPETYFDLAICTVIFAIVGARIFYVIFSWDVYKEHLLRIFSIRSGGLALYGGVIAAVITIIIFARLRELSAPLLLDTAVIGFVTGQIIGSFGNFFNREAFGEYTDGLLAMRLPVDAVRSVDITEKMKSHIELIDGVTYIQVHPTFLYESVWCLLLLAGLYVYRRYQLFEGELFFVYLFGYGIGRFMIESLRTDQLLLPVLGWPVSKVLSAIIAVGAAAWVIRGRKDTQRRRKKRRKAVSNRQHIRRSELDDYDN